MHNKKPIVALISVLFVCVCVLAVLMIFTVKDVIPTYTTANDSLDKSFAKEINSINEVLDGYKNRNLLFLDTEEVKASCLEYTDFEITAVEKIFPNKLSISLKQRLECFAVESDDGYYILDGNCYVLSKRADYVNINDGIQNILLSFSLKDFSVSDLAVGQALSVSLTDTTFQAMLDIYSAMLAPRNKLTAVSVDGVKKQVTLTMIEGIQIVIEDADDDGVKKIEKAMSAYNDESFILDSDKICGRILIYKATGSGEIVAAYTKE